MSIPRKFKVKGNLPRASIGVNSTSSRNGHALRHTAAAAVAIMKHAKEEDL